MSFQWDSSALFNHFFNFRCCSALLYLIVHLLRGFHLQDSTEISSLRENVINASAAWLSSLVSGIQLILGHFLESRSSMSLFLPFNFIQLFSEGNMSFQNTAFKGGAFVCCIAIVCKGRVVIIGFCSGNLMKPVRSDKEEHNETGDCCGFGI